MRYCLAPGCRAVVEFGRCPAHRRQQDQRRGSARARGYSARWERRARAFKGSYPLCGMRPCGKPPVMSQCRDEGRVTAAAHVDHVIPHRGDDALFWDEDNWQSLCAACHSRKTRAGL